MDADERGRVAGEVAHREGEVLQAVQLAAEHGQAEVAVGRGKVDALDALDQGFVGAAVGDEALDRADTQAVFTGEGDEVGQAGHGAILADDFATDAGRLEAGQACEVDGRFGVAGAAEHPAGLRPQGEGVPGRDEVGRRRRVVHQELDGLGAVGGGDAGGDAGVGGAVHAQREGRGETVAAVHARRQRDAQAVEEGAVARGAEQPAGLADAEVDGLGGDLLGGHDEVALILALRVIHDDNELPGPNILQARFHGVQRSFQILFHATNLSGPLVYHIEGG